MFGTINHRILESTPPARLFTIFAFAEMVTWAGLISAIIIRATSDTNLVPIAGGIHGFIFLCYSVTTIFVWVNQRWKTSRGVLGLVTAIIPFATVPYEISLKRKNLLEGSWRLAPGKDKPVGFIENVQAWILRYLIQAIVLGLILITVLFITLLWLGPPQLPGS